MSEKETIRRLRALVNQIYGARCRDDVKMAR